MILQTTGNNPILLYHAKIETGEITTNKKIWKTYSKLASDVLTTDSEFFYDPVKAEHIIGFFEKYLRHSKGKLGGQKIHLELWEKAGLASGWGFTDIEGLRKYRRVILIVGKKNGKSFISSGVGLYGLTADSEAGPEIYSVATKRDQAKIIWDEARRMRNKSPTLRKRIRATVGELCYDDNDGTFKPLANDVNTMDGLNVYYVLMDEFQQWLRGMALYNIMADGTSAREQPMIFMTSTAGTVREDIYDEIYDECTQIVNGYSDPGGYKDERTLPLIYELDKRSEWEDPACWIKANPNLGVSKSYKYLEEKVDLAKQNSKMIKNLVCKEFNIRETTGEAALTFEELDNRETFDIDKLKPRYGIGGCDLSATTDLTSATIVFQVLGDDRIYAETMVWLPSDLVEKRVREDHVPYDLWIDRGLCRACSGNRINYKDVVEWFLEMQEKHDIYLLHIGYDSWSAAYFVDDMQQTFGKKMMEPVIQGAKTLSSPMENLLADFRSKRIIYNNNPIVKWCLTNLAIEKDRNNNSTPIKAGSAKKRIDAFMSLLDAYVVYERHIEEYKNVI